MRARTVVSVAAAGVASAVVPAVAINVPYVYLRCRQRADGVGKPRRARRDGRPSRGHVAHGHPTGAGHAEVHAANAKVGRCAHHHRPVVIAHGGPHQIVARANGGRPRRAPDRVIGPAPAVGRRIVPAAVVRGHIAEGVGAHPDIAESGAVVPAAVAVGHIVRHHGRPPAGPAVHIHPLAVGAQVRHAHHRRGDLHFLGKRLVAVGQHACALAVPLVERVVFGAVKARGVRRQIARVNPQALRLRQTHRRTRLGAHLRAAPADAHGGAALLVHIHPHARVYGHVHLAGRGGNDETALAAADALHIKRTHPAAHVGRGGEGLQFRLASVGQAQKGAARQLDLGQTALVHPERIARHQQGVNRRTFPVFVRRALHQYALGVITHTAMQLQFLGAGRNRGQHKRCHHCQEPRTQFLSHGFRLLQCALEHIQQNEFLRASFKPWC